MKSGSGGSEMSHPSGVLTCRLQSRVLASLLSPRVYVAPAPSDEEEDCLSDGLSCQH